VLEALIRLVFRRWPTSHRLVGRPPSGSVSERTVDSADTEWRRTRTLGSTTIRRTTGESEVPAVSASVSRRSLCCCGGGAGFGSSRRERDFRLLFLGRSVGSAGSVDGAGSASGAGSGDSDTTAG